METETNTQTVTLHDSLILPDAVVIGRRDHRGKVIAGDIFTREELQAIVQQAFDKYDVAPDPFASPGSMDVEADSAEPDTDAWLTALAREPRAFA